MIIIFEEYNTSNKHTFTWYKGKWYIHYGITYKYKWEKQLGFLALISDVSLNTDSNAKHAPYKICGESIELYKNGKVKPGSGLAYSYTKTQFDELYFLTTEELFEKHIDIFITLFNKCVEDIKIDGWQDWYIKQIKLLFNLLVPVIKNHPKEYDEYLARIEAEKYNL